jgi:hypothetical protein
MDDEIRKIEDLEDGSSVYEFGPIIPEEQESYFHENLAEQLPEEALKKLSAFLLESIDEDIEARKPWLESVERIEPYLGFALEDSDHAPGKQFSRTYDTTLSTALIRFYATTKAELFPQAGPAGTKIVQDDNEQLYAQAKKIRDYLNYYLTTIDKAYDHDCDKSLLYLGLYGTVFRKVYFDKLTNKPLSRFIVPKDFIVDGDCTSILESNRLTHVLSLSKREIIFNQENNIYRNVELSYLKNPESANDNQDIDSSTKSNEEINLNVYSRRSLFPIYEVHTYLNLEDFISDNIETAENTAPLPYIVVIDKTSKEILSIRRNWAEDDEQMKRVNYFVQYNYLPGFGIYGIGLAHLIGSNAITLTKLLRQLVDAGSFKNLPGGLRAKGFKQQENDLVVGPGEFISVDTGGIPLAEAFMPLPYSEPSQALMELKREIIEQTRELASTSEMGMLDSKEDIATGTALAFLETNNRIQSAVLRSIHSSLSQELQLITDIFRKTLEIEEFSVDNEQTHITGEDFDESIKIIPVSDPVNNSTIQRIMKAETILKTAQQDPSIHNMPNIFRIVYKAMGVDEQEINNILLPSPEDEEVPPLDPISENVRVLKGEPISAAIWQEHAAHILTHGMFAEEYPETQPVIMAHIKEHQAYEYLIKMQELIGEQLPPLEEIQNPDVQNTIAMAVASSLGESDQDNADNQEQQTIDPNAVLMADIEQKAAETESRERIANLKAETDIFKSQLDFEKEKAKIESDEDIAKLKAETEVFKAELGFEEEQSKQESQEEIAQLKSETELTKQEINNAQKQGY